MKSTWNRWNDVCHTCRRCKDQWCSTAFLPTSQRHNVTTFHPGWVGSLTPLTSTTVWDGMGDVHLPPGADERVMPVQSWLVQCCANSCWDGCHEPPNGMKRTWRKRHMCVSATPSKGKGSMGEGVRTKPILMFPRQRCKCNRGIRNP